MPSRVEMRVRFERVLRGIAIAALAIMLWQSLRPSTDSTGGEVRARGVDRHTLAKWSALAKAPDRIQLQLDGVPTPPERAWLAALAGAGSRVSWSGALSPVMIDVQPIAVPTGGTRVSVAAPLGSPFVLSDEIGVIDTVRPTNFGAAIALRSVADRITVRVNGSVASTVRPDSVSLHKVLVIGSAGWESKFVITALEEEGWKVDGLISVAPSVDVAQGSAAAIDTSRYSAVVALDATASRYANRIVDFVRSGGGVVLEPSAALLDAMSSLRAEAADHASSQAATNPSSVPVSRATLAVDPITSLRTDGVALERERGAVAIAARRVGAGRVLQVGYVDSWRWRMGGAESGVRDHRLWWTGLLSSVAYASWVPRARMDAATDEAPLGALLSAVGPGAPATLSDLTGRPSDRMEFVLLLLALGLIVEITSRRLRGAP